MPVEVIGNYYSAWVGKKVEISVLSVIEECYILRLIFSSIYYCMWNVKKLEK